MLETARSLDEDQRLVFNLFIQFAIQLRQSQYKGTPRPQPPLVKVTAGAGAGKSHMIKATSQWFERIMNVGTNNDPDCPTVVRCCPTGKAARVIEGLTLHSAFNLSFGNKHSQLGDKAREDMRKALCNLALLIIDEVQWCQICKL